MNWISADNSINNCNRAIWPVLRLINGLSYVWNSPHLQGLSSTLLLKGRAGWAYEAIIRIGRAYEELREDSNYTFQTASDTAMQTTIAGEKGIAVKTKTMTGFSLGEQKNLFSRVRQSIQKTEGSQPLPPYPRSFHLWQHGVPRTPRQWAEVHPVKCIS